MSKIDDLKKAAKEYLDRETKILDAELNFLKNIQQKRGSGNLAAKSTGKINSIFVKNIRDFLSS